jgi:hypothetical protein
MRSSVGAEVEQLGVLEGAELRRDGLELHRADLRFSKMLACRSASTKGVVPLAACWAARVAASDR